MMLLGLASPLGAGQVEVALVLGSRTPVLDDKEMAPAMAAAAAAVVVLLAFRIGDGHGSSAAFVWFADRRDSERGLAELARCISSSALTCACQLSWPAI